MANSATKLIPFETASEERPTASELASEHSLLEIDSELDALLDEMQEQFEEQGEANPELMARFQSFCQAMSVKIDRIGRFLGVMETRAEHCNKESARYAARAKRAQAKVDRTKEMVLYYLASHDLKKVESDAYTLRRQKNSQDSVVISEPESIPADLRRFELKVEGPFWLEVMDALPDTLAEPLAGCVRSSEPSNSAIKERIANGDTVGGATVERRFHLRVE